MRLTLRTLLAYLDDTLAADQIKGMGEKVAESERAQELVDRIKKVTRRRGLGAPAGNGDEDSSADPNTVAEYLDNVLPADQLADVEEKALESDARLAEIAACHQILTLVLGEPVRVPPTARQRMYRIVKGRESIPFRKTAPSKNVAGVADPDEWNEEAQDEDALLSDLTKSKRLVPLLASLGLLIFLVIAIWVVLPSMPVSGRQGYVSVAANVPGPSAPQTILPKVVGTNVEIGPPPRPVKEEPKVVDAPKKQPEEEKKIVAEEKKEIKDKPPGVVVAKPDPERREIGKLLSRDTLVMQRKRDTERWAPVDPQKPLFTTDTLVSMPGYRSEVRLESGVQLRLWGNLPQFALFPVLDLLESRVIFHVAPKDFDADITLVSGRVYITRPVPKGQEVKPSKIRVRFKEEVWDVTLLEDEAEIAMDLMGSYPGGVPFSRQPGGESPMAEFYFGILKGKVGVHIGFKDFAMLPAPTRIDWDNKGAGATDPVQIKDKGELLWWSTDFPAKLPKEIIADFQNALGDVARRIVKEGAIPEVVFAATLKEERPVPAKIVLSVLCLEAIDDIESLAAVMGDDNFITRFWAVRAATHWCGQGPERDLMFYKALLASKFYDEKQALIIMQLLHPFSREVTDPRSQDPKRADTINAMFDFLKHEKSAVRELALLRLAELDPEGANEFGNTLSRSPDDRRDAIVEMWKSSWKRRFEKK
jgi:hypothetical protein